ncbi:glycoside hydrolase family 15 protein [Thelephora terrestris]|uniref:Glycoside hydrolase family 15 protein n=1 Tax=Thelephora terrestris TaxID=56493 RepID=A0A9P6L1X0_9AGAM|nr:glycoside hydrolase family 15 protein [Thelephora terrestris]
MEDKHEDRGYTSISDHGLIGNLRTAALVSSDGSVESYCVPDFDSPSIFARILDKDKGGHFSITPAVDFSTKQSYLPSSNILQTKFLNEGGVVQVADFLPRQSSTNSGHPPLRWLIRRVEVIRGVFPLKVQVAPAFNYARDKHDTHILPDHSVPGCLDRTPPHNKALFVSENLSLDFRYISESVIDGVPAPEVDIQLLDLTKRGHLGLSASIDLNLIEGQVVTFVLRSISPSQVKRDLESQSPGLGMEQALQKVIPSPKVAEELGIDYKTLVSGASKLRAADDPLLTAELLSELFTTTNQYWVNWIRRSTYTGSWKEAVNRSALALKLLIYEPTGAVVASPTFSLPEFIGGGRNWDYRASWIRDSSFTLYALIRLGYTYEANAYMDFIFERLKHKNPDGSLQIMYTIHGEKTFPEEELLHLDGHKGSKPVRIGNGAIDHIQLDIYGELMDCIYLSQKYGRPLSYDTWVAVRELVDYVVKICNEPDLSIWEVRNKHRHFTYSKIMLWVALDRGLRLADKRSLPCPHRNEWITARDELYEQIMHKAWNKDLQIFGQSYEETDVLDSSVMIMPLVFFMNPSDPRFLSTLKAVLKSPERGGLTSNGLVYRYDVTKADDGVGGEEGTFCLCTLWAIEALTRAGEYDKGMLSKAVTMFEDFLQYLNHVGLCTEEISTSGEALGNAVQGFTHVTLISTAFNLSRTLAKYKV